MKAVNQTLADNRLDNWTHEQYVTLSKSPLWLCYAIYENWQIFIRDRSTIFVSSRIIETLRWFSLVCFLQHNAVACVSDSISQIVQLIVSGFSKPVSTGSENWFESSLRRSNIWQAQWTSHCIVGIVFKSYETKPGYWIRFKFVEIQVGLFAIFDKEVNDVWFMKKRSNRVGPVWGVEGI